MQEFTDTRLKLHRPTRDPNPAAGRFRSTHDPGLGVQLFGISHRYDLNYICWCLRQRLAAFAVSLPGALQLDQLETLYFRSNHADANHDKWLCQLYRCIASNSRHLREVQILLSDEGKYFFDKGGDIFFATVMRHHKYSIRSFGLSCVTVSEPTLARFIHACPQLEELKFSLSKLDPVGSFFTAYFLIWSLSGQHWTYFGELARTTSNSFGHCTALLQLQPGFTGH